MTEKQKARILYPAWLTKEQAEMLRHAEKGELPADLEKKFKKALGPYAGYKPSSLHISKREFADTKEGRFYFFLAKEFGSFFGTVLCARFFEYGAFPKPEAEKNSLYMMKHFDLMRKA